jgi:hypothetical protein
MMGNLNGDMVKKWDFLLFYFLFFWDFLYILSYYSRFLYNLFIINF